MQSNSWQNYQKLKQKKYRDKFGLFLVEGVRLCREALSSGWKIKQIYINESFIQHPEYAKFNKLFKLVKSEPVVLADNNFQKLTDTVTPQGIAVILKKPVQNIKLDRSLQERQIILLLDEISDPGNMGTILRTADWFGVDLIICEKSADIFSPKVVRSSMGAIFHLPIWENIELLKVIMQIKKNSGQLIGTSLNGKTDFPRLFKEQTVALVLGNEAHGVRQEIQEHIENNIKIAGYGRSESLNVAVASGILMEKINQSLR